MSKVTSTVSLGEPNRFFLKGAEADFVPAKNNDPGHTMVIDPSKSYQPLLGLGSIWTETDTYALLRMSKEKQEEALQLLFNPETGAGWNIMRIPLGSTDWEIGPAFYSYDDMPAGEKDWNLEHFSIQGDINKGVFDICRRAREINPNIVYFASVWCIPGWMKESDTFMYGRFLPECVDVYAKYLTKAVAAFKEQGIDLYALTPQNESLIANDRATPATLMPWWVQQKLAVKLRQELDAAGFDTRIWIFDHTFWMNDFYVNYFLEDEEARKAIDGVAYHDYEGDPCVMRNVVEKYPDMKVYLTEKTLLSAPQYDHLVKELRCYIRSYTMWTTMSDQYGGPHLFRGKPFVYGNTFSRGGTRYQNFLYNQKEDPNDLRIAPSYGLYGSFTKFIKQGMVRIDSTYGSNDWLTGVAFMDKETGKCVLVTVNATDKEQPLVIRLGGQEAVLSQAPDSTCAFEFDAPLSLCDASAAEHCGVSDVNAELKEYKIGPAPGNWDINVIDIKLNGPEKAGADLPLSVVVENAGDTPTPEGATLYTEFKLDGDIIVGQSHVCMPVLQPGEKFEAAVNVPVGMPYFYRIPWHAEQGVHEIFAFCTVGNAYIENWQHNNVWAKMFNFE